MNTDFIENVINIKDLPKDTIKHLCLLENSEKQIGEICDFLQGDKKLCLINGFQGCGKTQVVNFITSKLNPDVYVIPYTCFETTILDDMLLSFFETFRGYTLQGKLFPPKLKVENFTQKINAYFNSITKPVVIVLNSYESILKNNKQDILNFLHHLSKYPNVKIIITSRKINQEEFANFDFVQSTILAFSKDNFEKFLKENGIKNIGVLSNELYKQTRGYYGYINICVKIMTLREMTLSKFLEVYSKSCMMFSDFILREILTLVDPVSLHLFRLLAIMRIPIHLNLIKSLHLYNPEMINFFTENTLLSVDAESVYLKDYYREIIENQIQDKVMMKLHRACIELYNTQLPLKPLERDLRLSRQTMRNEIDYHVMFLPKRPALEQPVQEKPIVQPLSQQKQEEPVINTTTQIVEETKEEKIEKINFIIEDEEVLNNIAESIKDFVTEQKTTNDFALKTSNMPLTNLLNAARKQEAQYNYKNAALLYQNALIKKDDENFDRFLPTIYLSLAKVYKHTSQWYEALEYYTKAQDYYFNVSNQTKVSEIKLEIANIYFIIYKQDNARYILEELDKSKALPAELRIKVNMSLAKLSNNLNEEYSYYKKSIALVNSEVSKQVAAELFYKFAGVSDEKDDPKTAVIYYKKCIDIDSNPHTNEYISKSYANLAQLYDEGGNTQAAIKFYEKSIELDTIAKNYNGLYTSSRNLSEIYSGKNSKKSLEYLKLSMDYAKQLNEPYYIADVASEIANYYLLRKDFENSYVYYKQALDISSGTSSNDNVEKIRSRLEYIKRFVGEELYKKLQEKHG